MGIGKQDRKHRQLAESKAKPKNHLAAWRKIVIVYEDRFGEIKIYTYHLALQISHKYRYHKL